ncbi:MAG: hypothetical protein JWO06_2400, partial [Bacteroidota bacterium]|nr:hypothetical protein [Bacteroidota bacterium]
DIASINSSQLNNVQFLTFPAYEAQNPVIDSTAAWAIFAYCANQTCGSPNAEITPCIPFQYILDGCEARANKMCVAINNKFRYHCAKVFSMEQDITGHQLSVYISKWGNCCFPKGFYWWWHVAPILQVKFQYNVVAMVIDPGMFNEPVPLSSWLAAQQDSRCTGDFPIKLDSYSIQSDAAYIPAADRLWFETDPGMVCTDATLRYYQNAKSCGPYNIDPCK